MRIVLGYRTFASLGGSETYLLTVAEQLQLLGHEVLIDTHQRGLMAEIAESRGVRVVEGERDLPADCDAVLVQDGELAYALAGRFPDAPRVFVAHSVEFVSQLPPQLEHACAAIVVMNDRIRSQLEHAASNAEIVRLRQPIDLIRFSRYGIQRDRPRKALVFGNDHGGIQYRQIERACTHHGLEVELVGVSGRTSPSPEHELAEADVVIGIGRCVLEAMACRKAAYVSGVVGGDGWVTPDTYDALEGDGFSGRATPRQLTEELLREDLAAWLPEMGERNKDLAFAHHDAARHAAELVSLWNRLGSAARPVGASEELERMARVHAQTENRALTYAAESTRSKARAEALRLELEQLKSTRRYRLAVALAWPLDALRSLARGARRLVSRR